MVYRDQLDEVARDREARLIGESEAEAARVEVSRRLIAAAVAAEQVMDLVDRGVTDFHFYTMNRADLVFAISHLLGIRPDGAQRAA